MKSHQTKEIIYAWNALVRNKWLDLTVKLTCFWKAGKTGNVVQKAGKWYQRKKWYFPLESSNVDTCVLARDKLSLRAIYI